MTHTKEFLILELQRFVRENGRVPKHLDMQSKFGYPSFTTYVSHFGTWNNALEAARLKINKKHRVGTLDRTETCSYCGCSRNETSGWVYPDGIRYCKKHGQRGLPDYVKATLNINSSTGRGRAGEICVVKALKIGDEHDCALISMGYPFDMYKEEYGKINVKTSCLNNSWAFNFGAKKVADTYICIGMSSGKTYVEHVWIVPNEDEIRNLQAFGIYDTYGSLRNHKKWEVNSEIYDNAWQDMLLNYTDGNCKVFGKKEQTQKIKLQIYQE